MQEPKITVTQELLKLIAEIDEFKGKWEALKNLSPERLRQLRKVATIESIGSMILPTRGQGHAPRNAPASGSGRGNSSSTRARPSGVARCMCGVINNKSAISAALLTHVR